MPHHDPTAVPALTYAWVTGLSLLSSLAGYLSRFNNGKEVKRPLLTFFQDICYCQLAGLSSYFVAQTLELSEMQSILLVSIGSHMGARFIGLLQNAMTKQISIGIKANQEE